MNETYPIRISKIKINKQTKTKSPGHFPKTVGLTRGGGGLSSRIPITDHHSLPTTRNIRSSISVCTVLLG